MIENGSMGNAHGGTPTGEKSLVPALDTGEKQVRDSLVPPNLFAGASVLQRIFSFAAMLGMILVVRLFFALRSFTIDPDVWWHIKIGQGILATHHWPTAETYSFTAAGQHWRAYEWLGEVLLAAIYRIGGLRSLGVLLIVLASIFALALYYYTSVRCGNPKAGFLVTLFLLTVTDFCNLRPQMLGYIFLVLTLIILQRFRQGKRAAIWLLPPLMLVWVNTHGTWIIGLGTVGVYLACGLIGFRFGSVETSKWSAPDRIKLMSVLALSAVATVITPYGAGIARFPFQMSSLPLNLANIEEWQPINFSLTGKTLFLILVLAFFIAQIVLRPRWRLEELGLFMFASVMPFIHMRFLALFVAYSAPVLVVILARWIPKYDRTKEMYAVNAAVIVALVALMVWHFPSRSDYQHDVEKTYPVAAVEYLNTHSVPGPMYNNYGFGGYLVFARGPEHKVYIDGRGEIYEPAGIMREYVQLGYLAPGSLAILDKHNIQSCLVAPKDALATALAVLPGWQKVYSDDVSILFVRRQSATLPGDEDSTAQTDYGAVGGA